MKTAQRMDEDSHCGCMKSKPQRQRCSGISGIIVAAASLLVIHQCMFGSTPQSNSVWYDSSGPSGDSFTIETREGSGGSAPEGFTAPSDEFPPLLRLLEAMRKRNTVDRFQQRIPDPDLLGVGDSPPRRLKQAHATTPMFPEDAAVVANTKAGKKAPTAVAPKKVVKEGKGKKGSKANTASSVPLPPEVPIDDIFFDDDAFFLTTPLGIQQETTQETTSPKLEVHSNVFMALFTPASTQPSTQPTLAISTPPSAQPSTIPTQGNIIITNNVPTDNGGGN